MSEDITKDFFKAGSIYTDNPIGLSVEFKAVMITRNPSTGDKVAFGFMRWGDDGPWVERAYDETDYRRFSIKEGA